MKRFPIGIEDFEEMIKEDYYYVDKTLLIKMLKMEGGKVTLFTRPRRFGKTLNMSMLKYFFKLDTDKSIFSGLNISNDTAFCDKYMGKYPVISITLKNVEGNEFVSAFYGFCRVIADEADNHSELKNSEKLDEEDKKTYSEIINLRNYPEPTPENIDRLSAGLINLMKLMHKHYDIPVAVLIDEYDVPLDKAHVYGYYDKMVGIIRNMFNMALKTNEHLAFGVLTGCLRVSKESIFTGMNNLQINSITEDNGFETFGFTEKEVDDMLSFFDISDKKAEAKAWYDGYRFGNSDVYCPWDMVNYCSDMYFKKRDFAISYWSNTSSNSLVREFVNIATNQTKDDLERLVNGEHISKKIWEELTYRDIDDNIENLWSVLYLTGYLTGFRESGESNYSLWIPNREVQRIFEDDIQKWFVSYVKKDHASADEFYNSAFGENPNAMEDVLNALLFDSVSLRDIQSRKYLRENFYHVFILGLLTGFDGIDSNAESGNGYSDISMVNKRKKTAVIMELKYSDSDKEASMEAACQDALKQIDDMKYDLKYTKNGVFKKVIKYGISFYCKTAMVRKSEIIPQVE